MVGRIENRRGRDEMGESYCVNHLWNDHIDYID